MTTKIGVIGDIHGNLPALEAVLSDARARGVSALWDVGDAVGYGAFPDEVVSRLRAEGVVSILGNYDQRVLECADGTAHVPRQIQKRLALQWACARLSARNRGYLRALLPELRMEVEGRRVLMVHGSPSSPKEHLSPDTPRERLRELAAAAGADVVLCGHSHRPFARKEGSTWFINPGSVGRPDDGDPRASYCVLYLNPRFVRARLLRVAYDVEREARALADHSLPAAFADMARCGRSLDAILEAAGRGSNAAEDTGEEWLDRDERLLPLLCLAERCDYDVAHTWQVARLALRIFDQLEVAHGLGPRERYWLQAAALLHDIGWVEGHKDHHKASLRLILEAQDLPFGERERLIVASVARYHRGAMPSEQHEHFAALAHGDRFVVSLLASCLRLADGLDSAHENAVTDVRCTVTPQEVLIHVEGRSFTVAEKEWAAEKGQLLEMAFGRHLVLTWPSR